MDYKSIYSRHSDCKSEWTKIASPNGRKIRMGRKLMKCVIFGKSDISFVNLTIPFCENDHRFCKYDIIFSFFTSATATYTLATVTPPVTGTSPKSPERRA